MRQRVRTESSPLAYVGRLILALVCLATIWCGLMLMLLAVKVNPDGVERISGYRTVFAFAERLGPDGFPGGTVRLAVAAIGLVACLLFVYLALRELPRPYLARSELALAEDHRGALTVEPRAIERAAEAAASQDPAVASAVGRYGGEDLSVDVNIARPGDGARALEGVRERVTEALGRHDLPPLPVNVTLTGFHREEQRRRELS